MVKAMIYYMYEKESFMGRTALKIGQNRLAAALVAVDALCWGSLLFFAIHFFTCPAAQRRFDMRLEFIFLVAIGFALGAVIT